MPAPVRLAAALGTALIATPASAQFPYGVGAAGTGGVVPAISCNQPWTGRTDFAIAIDRGLGGAAGVVLLGFQPANATLAGLPLYVDLAAVGAQQLILLSGAPGVAGAGAGSMTVSLAAATASFVGLDLYAQAALIDPAGPGFGGGWSATGGLHWEVTRQPQVFAACSVGGSTDPHWALHGLLRTVDFAGGNQFTDNVDGAAYTDDGDDLYLSSGFGRLAHADLAGGAPSWSWLNTNIGSTGVAWDNCVIDRDRQRLWMMGQVSGSVELLSIDIDEASATYGQVVDNTTTLSATVGLVGTWYMSHDRRRAAVPGLFGGSLHLVDTDPLSATFLQVVSSSPIPTSALSSGLALNVRVRFSPDDTECYVLIQNTGTIPAEIARFLVPAGIWLDHDPATPTIEHIGPLANPPVPFGSAPLGFDVSRDGALWVCGWAGTGFAGRVTLNGLAPGWSPLNATSSLQNARNVALNRDETVLAVAVANPTTSILFFDVATRNQTGAVGLGASFDTTVLAWR